MLSKHLSLLRARNKRDIALKAADAEAAMEKLAAGFEKTESGLRYQFIQRRRKL
jgi:peptidyl-prolyl cis-trans isomerase A (cyclophilin A)